MSDATPIQEEVIQESVINPKVDGIASKALVGAIQQLQGFRHQDHFSSLVSHMTTTLTASVQSRESYFNELANYRNTWLTNGIYDIIQNDVFVDNGSTEYITVKIDKYPEVEEEINKMFAKLNIANLVMSIFPDLLHNGTYYLRPVIKSGVGIVDFVDDLEPKAVIGISDSKNNPLMYFVANSLNNRSANSLDGSGLQTNNYLNNSKTAYEYLNITELVQFSLDLSYAKLNLPDKVGRQLKSKTPDLAKRLLPQTLKIKTSQSFVWPVIDKLKETLLLDKLSVYRDIGSILTPNLVGIPVPDAYDPVQLIEIVKKYDELLNSNTVKLSNTQNIELTMRELSTVKVVPIVGDRSTPTSLDIGRSAPISSMEALNDSLARLLNSLGVPKELFDGQMDSKSNVKTNVRYAKKIKRIQKNISRTLVFLCLLHISEKYPGLNVLAEDINIQLRNNTNIDELENMESQDLVVSSITSVKNMLVDLEEIVVGSSYEVNRDEFIEAIAGSFASLGSKYSNVFKKKEVPTDKVYTNDAEIEAEAENSQANEEPKSISDVIGDKPVEPDKEEVPKIE